VRMHFLCWFEVRKSNIGYKIESGKEARDHTVVNCALVHKLIEIWSGTICYPNLSYVLAFLQSSCLIGTVDHKAHWKINFSINLKKVRVIEEKDHVPTKW
jgi:hypothetical protein